MNLLRSKIAAIGGSLALLPAIALAEVPAAFTTAVTGATADGVDMAEALMGMAAAFVVVYLGIKFVKKIKSAA